MGLEKVEIVDQTGENDENRIVGANSEPDNDRIEDPTSESKLKSNVSNAMRVAPSPLVF